MGSRRLGREIAVQALYRLAITGEAEVGPTFWEECGGSDGPARAFGMELVEIVRAERARIEAVLGEATENWRMERLAVVDSCVLRVAAAELLGSPHTPVPIVIDEAVEIARRFGGEGSAAFVNGVLDRVARNARAGEGEEESRVRR